MSVADLLRMVIPKGSMQEICQSILFKSGFRYESGMSINGERTSVETQGVLLDRLETTIFKPFCSVAQQRAQTIPLLIKQGHFDLGFCGRDWMANWDVHLPILLRFPIGRKNFRPVKIVLAASSSLGYKSLDDLPQGAVIATEYLHLAKRLVADRNRVDIEVIQTYGVTEDSIAIGTAHAIIDVVESGRSLAQRKLSEIETILESELLLVVNPDTYQDEKAKQAIESLVERIADLKFFSVEVQPVEREGHSENVRQMLISIFHDFYSGRDFVGYGMSYIFKPPYLPINHMMLRSNYHSISECLGTVRVERKDDRVTMLLLHGPMDTTEQACFEDFLQFNQEMGIWKIVISDSFSPIRS